MQLICFKYLCVSHLEEECISNGVAEAENKVFLWMFRHSLNNAALHPQCMFRSAVMVNPRSAIGFVQEKSATLRNIQKQKVN